MMAFLCILLTIPGALLYADNDAQVNADNDVQAAMSQNIYNQLKAGQRIDPGRAYTAPEKPTAYLTFDDGPSRLTGKVLDILKEEGVPATFFALGSEAEKVPELVRRIVSEGHALGNHTYNHVYSQLYGKFDTFWEQVQRTEKILEDTAGVHTTLVRAPGGTGGNFDPFYFTLLERAGYTVYDWNIDSEDSRRAGVPKAEIIAGVNKGPFRHEAVVLMHDGAGHEESVKALPDVIKLLRNKGYEFASLTDKVKPPQQTGGRLKWQRNYSIESFLDSLGAADRHRQAEEERGYPNNTLYASSEDPLLSGAEEIVVQNAPEPVVAAGAQDNRIPLNLQYGDRQLVFPESSYELRDSRLQVPLRLLIEQMGGYVSWDESGRTATVQVGKYSAQYDLSKHQLRVLSPGYRLNAISLPEMELSDGSIIVPLRDTIEMLGKDISGYTISKDYREVVVAPSSPSSSAGLWR
jgi:peptidoglycan/xylan/chitin deacetylase (PgdA/CDA1 family)